MEKVGVYCRLSDEDRYKKNKNDDSKSIANQKSMLLKYALGQGWEIVDIHFDSLKKILYLNSSLPIEDFQVISKNYKITFGNVGNMEYLLTDYNNRIFVLLYKDGKVQCQLVFHNYEDKEIFELLSIIKID